MQRTRFDDLADALEAAEGRVRELSEGAPRREVNLRFKRFNPAEQVFARIELAGPERLLPSVRAGVDVRGDGSAEPYIGRVRREPVQMREDEPAVSALRRVLR